VKRPSDHELGSLAFKFLDATTDLLNAAQVGDCEAALDVGFRLVELTDQLEKYARRDERATARDEQRAAMRTPSTARRDAAATTRRRTSTTTPRQVWPGRQ
jgi:hypothetical protein